MNVEAHNSTTPSAPQMVFGPGRERPPAGLTLREQQVWLSGYDAGMRDQTKKSHPAGLHKPTHGGHCG